MIADAILDALADVLGRRPVLQGQQAVGGGCINEAQRLDTDAGAFFVKTNEAALLPMFEAEAEGLRELAAAEAIRVPEPFVTGTAAGWAFLVMEYLPTGAGGGEAAARMGRALAAMHRHTAARFGWHRDNTIGSTPQPNAWHHDWVAFWRERRLGHQLDLAARHGAPRGLIDKGRRLQERLDAFFGDYTPVPSVLHGDLWSGNAAFTAEGEPVIFDPAVYYGDREADLAMTELFGGFPDRFYAAYREAWPLDPGYGVRRTLYNLYHILNHFNLFGGGYASQAQRMTEQLLAEL